MVFKLLKRYPLWPQWLAAIEIFLTALMIGLTLGWSSPFLAKLTRADPPFVVTKEQMSWIASLVSLSRPAGTIIGTIITANLGSKNSTFICGLYFFVSWICLIFASSIEVVFVTLIFAGIGWGSLHTTYPNYIGEIASPKIRGGLISLITQGLLFGYLFGNIMGAHLEPWVYAAINLVPNLVFITTFFFFPSTPYHLIKRNKMEEASESIKFYTRDVDAPAELKRLSDFMAVNPKLSFLATLKEFTIWTNFKTLLMMNVVYSFVQLSGYMTILEYMEILFTKAQIDAITPSTLVTCMSFFSITANWVAMFTTDKFGRTSILFFSSTLMALSLIAWGIRYHLIDIGNTTPEFQWLVIVASAVFRISCSMGVLTIVPTLMSEIFAPNLRNVGSCLCNILSALCTFISNKYFQTTMNYMTAKYVFYMFAAIIFAVGIFAKVVIPETKGKTLKEIQDMLTKKVDNRNNDQVKNADASGLA